VGLDTGPARLTLAGVLRPLIVAIVAVLMIGTAWRASAGSFEPTSALVEVVDAPADGDVVPEATLPSAPIVRAPERACVPTTASPGPAAGRPHREPLFRPPRPSTHR
jgi:hypothetical protein